MNIDRTNQCGYCLSKVIGENKLLCFDCKRYIHIQCLKRPGTPGDFIGDVFFKFQCSNCTVDGKEDFNRIQLPWSMIIVLAIHNLSIQSKGLSHHGFFHWRRHIANFIEKNWHFLFVAGAKKKKSWIGTISGSLSHNTPDLFASGFDVFQESGWWKLTHKYSPKQYLHLCGPSSKKRKLPNDDVDDDNDEINQSTTITNAQTITTDGTELLSVDSSEDLMFSEKKIFDQDDDSVSFSRTLPFMGRPPRMKITQQTSLNNQLDLDKFLASNIPPSIMPLDTIQLGNETTSIPPINSITPLTNLPDDLFDTNDDSATEFSSSISYNDNININNNPTNCQFNKPRIIQVINYQETSASSSEESTNHDDNDDDDDEDEEIDCTNDLKIQIPIENKITMKLIDEDEEYSLKFPCKPSLFSHTTKLTNQKPWKIEEKKSINEIKTEIDIPHTGKIILATIYEEKEMFLKLKTIITDYDKKNVSNSIEIPSYIRRFYRKLFIRNENRMMDKPVFDLDNLLGGNGIICGNDQNKKQNKSNVLDRYYHQLIISSSTATTNKITPTIQSNLAGISEFELFESPHTKRILHPFVYRNKKTFPLWLKLMCELQYTVNNGKIPVRGTIDYCYVRPQHIAAVNCLLQRMFWPGIDMSECLSYPDFSIVALYKKLVIGCAFLVPDVNDNDAYVSFMAVRPGWQRAGIASFMLYHLTQTCMGKDITLHVSANNSAICLYQKFGFKIEEVILDFYEKYLPLDTKESRHAFFLRLKR